MKYLAALQLNLETTFTCCKMFIFFADGGFTTSWTDAVGVQTTFHLEVLRLNVEYLFDYLTINAHELSRGKQLVLFPENLNVSRGGVFL